MKTIKVYTNLVSGGWSANQLKTGIGGSEEKLIEWAEAMAKSYDVTIYMNGEHGEINKVKYLPHNKFIPWEHHDLFVSFKAAHILQNSINADLKVHWTTEIERAWPKHMLRDIDLISCISKYHKRRMGFESDKLKSMYLWADLGKLDGWDIQKEKGSMLYSASFDRGLEDLLNNWELVKKRLKLKKLYITYGWEFMDKVIKFNPHMRPWKDKMVELMKQKGIVFIGRLDETEMNKMYWKCEYWCLPLNNPDSELFCINAVKAQYAKCKPVVKLAGALQETVHNFIAYEPIIEGRKFNNLTDEQIKENREFAMENFNLADRIKEWTDLIESENSLKEETKN